MRHFDDRRKRSITNKQYSPLASNNYLLLAFRTVVGSRRKLRRPNSYRAFRIRTYRTRRVTHKCTICFIATICGRLNRERNRPLSGNRESVRRRGIRRDYSSCILPDSPFGQYERRQRVWATTSGVYRVSDGHDTRYDSHALSIKYIIDDAHDRARVISAHTDDVDLYRT